MLFDPPYSVFQPSEPSQTIRNRVKPGLQTGDLKTGGHLTYSHHALLLALVGGVDGLFFVY